MNGSVLKNAVIAPDIKKLNPFQSVFMEYQVCLLQFANSFILSQTAHNKCAKNILNRKTAGQTY